MNNTPRPPAENALQKEQLLFRELFDRLINALLNRLFDLRPERATRRMRYLIILFVLMGAVIILSNYPLILWLQYLSEIFSYIFIKVVRESYIGDPFTKFGYFVIQAVLDPRSFQYFPIFLAPFFIALHLAALYLADIFELDDVAVARSFVWEVALTGSDETIRISEGKIEEQHLQSSNYLIGGPGKVIVDLDSVALFERADGTPHVIGPTGKEPGGKATLDGFERFRQAIDIRDQHVDLSITSRSRDGIPITATDIRLVFSIDRGENLEPTPEFPYQFDKGAIERIVYKSSSKVTPEKTYPSNYEFSWLNNMSGLIRRWLGGFMSERNLTEYLANIGMPEIEKSKQRDEQIAEQVQHLAQPPEEASGKPPKLPPTFTSRQKITNLFSQFTEDFTKSARNSGVVLHWIGVGTWKIPLEIDVISEKHLEAWKLSQDNIKDGSPDAMKKVERKAILGKMEALIRNIPIDAYYEIIGSKKQSSKKPAANRKHDVRFRDDDNDDDILFDEDEILDIFDGKELKMGDLKNLFNEKIDASVEKRLKKAFGETNRRDGKRRLLLEYRKELLEAVEFIKAKNEPVPTSIEEAVNYINNQMGLKHWAGSSQTKPGA